MQLNRRSKHYFSSSASKRSTLIRNNEEKIVRSIVGYDANALYLCCTSQNMPMGRPRVYRRNSESGQLELAFEPDVSGKQNAWLAELVCKFSDLCFAIKNGEQRVGPKKIKSRWVLSKNKHSF